MPSGNVLIVKESAAGAILIVSGPVVVSAGLLESVTVTVTVDAPAVVGALLLANAHKVHAEH